MRRAILGTAILLALLTRAPAPARAIEVAANGDVTFSADAIKHYDFEDATVLRGLIRGADWVNGDAGSTLQANPLTPTDITAALSVSVPKSKISSALEGQHALLIKQSGHSGIVLSDNFAALAAERISVTMWGRAMGAEPTLEVIYDSATPFAESRLHVIAVRTGRETSDGWVEYSTGPMDGAAWTHPISMIVSIGGRERLFVGRFDLLLESIFTVGVAAARSEFGI